MMRQLWRAPLALALACAGCSSAGEPDPVPLTDFTAEQLAAVHAVRDRMVEIRGLAPGEQGREGWIGNTAYEEWSRKASQDARTDEAEDEIAAVEEAFRLLRIIDEDDSLLDQAEDFSAAGIAGFYSGDDRQLVVIGEIEADLGPFEKTLAHEYVHSLQDSAFDWFEEDRWTSLLEQDEDDVESTEYAMTLSCLVEGDATFATEEYVAAHPVAPEPDPTDEQVESIDEVSDGLLRWYLFNYSECPAFVASIHDEGGWEAVDALYERPPATTEQILDPEKYRTDERPTDLRLLDLTAQLPDGWERDEYGSFGQFDTYNYLVSALTSDKQELALAVQRAQALADQPGLTEAQRAEIRALTVDDVVGEAQFAAITASSGWGAGWLSLYRRPIGPRSEGEEQVLLHLSLQWDTDEDLQEFLAVYGRVANVVSRYGLEVSDPENGPARWNTSRDTGYVEWDEETRTVDVLIATHSDDFDALVEALNASRATAASTDDTDDDTNEVN